MTASPVSLSPRFTAALEAARQWHDGQLRKGSDVPYLSHPLAVAALVLDDGGDEEEAIGALLHDAVEDTDATVDEIGERFGERVATIVDLCTDSDVGPGQEKAPWRERKEAHLVEIAHAVHGEIDGGALRVLLADKVVNARSMLSDHRRLGLRSWDRFNAPPADQLWYYDSVLATIAGRGSSDLEEQLRALVDELHDAVELTEGSPA